MSKDRTLPLAFQERSFYKTKDIFLQHCGREQGEFQKRQHLLLGRLRGPAQGSAAQNGRRRQKGRSVPEHGVAPVSWEHPLPLSELTSSIWRVCTVKTVQLQLHSWVLSLLNCVPVLPMDTCTGQFIRGVHQGTVPRQPASHWHCNG